MKMPSKEFLMSVKDFENVDFLQDDYFVPVDSNGFKQYDSKYVCCSV